MRRAEKEGKRISEIFPIPHTTPVEDHRDRKKK